MRKQYYDMRLKIISCRFFNHCDSYKMSNFLFLFLGGLFLSLLVGLSFFFPLYEIELHNGPCRDIREGQRFSISTNEVAVDDDFLNKHFPFPESNICYS